MHRRIVEAATADGVSVSAWMTDAARRTLKIRDGLAAVGDWEREHGAFSEEELVVARERAARPARRSA